MTKTLLKGLDLMETLARMERPCGVSELSRAQGLVKSNVHRLLQALVNRGFARKTVDGAQYEITSKLWELGSCALAHVDVKRAAMTYMRMLRAKTGETVHLSTLEGSDVIYIDKVESPHPVRAYSRIGGRAPAYCVATGKALLAYQPPELIVEISQRMERFTSLTIVGRRELEAELERIRKMGYAVNRGEWRDGVCGIAAPIFDMSQTAVAAIGLSGPAGRMRARRLREYAPQIVQAASAISRSMGHISV